MSFSSGQEMRYGLADFVRAIDKIADAAMIAAKAYSQKVDRDIDPQMKVNPNVWTKR